jgi:hypothetical protein
MSPPLRQRSRCRTVLAAAAMVCLPLAGCSSEEADGSGQGKGSSREVDTKRVSAAGLSFEAPEGWEELDAAELAEGSGEGSAMAEVAEGMGVNADQLEQMVRSLDLMLVSDEGADNGLLANLNVLRVPGPMPNDTQVKLQFMHFGADVKRISHERSDLGDTTVVVYELEVTGKTAQGEALFVDVGGSPVSVTVTASERETTDEIADRIVDTLAEAS